MVIKSLKFTFLSLIVFGLSVCGYLLFRHFTFTTNGANIGFDICSAIFGTGCDLALRNPASIQLGLPLAGWGVVYYTTLAACLIVGWSLKEDFEFEATLAALGLSLIACFVSVTLIVILFMEQLPFCPLCIVIHILNLILVVLLKHMCGRPITQLFQAFASGAKYLLTGKGADPRQARWKLLGFITVTLVALVMYQWVLIEDQSRKLSDEMPFNPRQALVMFESNPKQTIPLNANDPNLGLSGAPVQLVVFSDFQCPACANFSHSLTNLINKFEGKTSGFL